MTTTETSARNGRLAPGQARPPSGGPRPPGRRRQAPLVVLGVLVVLGCALGFAEVSAHSGARQEVLVTAAPLAAGQVLTAADLQRVAVSVGSGLAVVPANQEGSVIARPVAVPLAAGALLTAGEVGPPAPVAAGTDVVAVGVKPGGYPPALGPGARVQVVPVVGSSSGATPSGSPVEATVLAVAAAPASSDTPTVFTLQVAEGNAAMVARLAAAGEAALVQLGAGR